MAVTMNQVRAALTPEEPDYNQAATLGPEALPYLRTLVQEAEPMLASKATYLASLIEHPDAVAVVRDAAQSNKSVEKVAAAAAAANLSSEEASDIIASLITDPDIGVRKTAIKAVPPDATDRVQAALTRVSDSDSHPELRSL